MIHDITNIEGTLCLTDNIAHHGICDELSKFRCEIWDNLSLLTFPHLCIRIVPPCLHDSILQRRATFSLEVLIREEADQIGDSSSLWIIHKREASIAEIILNTRTEDLISEEFNHNVCCIGNDHLFLIVIRSLEHIESHRTSKISRIKIDNIISSFARNVSDKFFREISVGIENRKSLSAADILACHG